MADKAAIHIVEDDDAMRQSLEMILQDAGYEVHAYSRAEEFTASGAAGLAGCVISDVRMPGMNGLDLLRHLRAQGCAAPVVLITGHGDVRLAVAAMKAGATDFLEKPIESDGLLGAIEAALDSGTGSMGNEQVAQAARQRLDGLTPRELDVLGRLVAGSSNKEAAAELQLSPRTVEFHRAHIFAKTGAKGLPELVRLWMESGSFLQEDLPSKIVSAQGSSMSSVTKE